MAAVTASPIASSSPAAASVSQSSLTISIIAPGQRDALLATEKLQQYRKALVRRHVRKGAIRERSASRSRPFTAPEARA
jgi:hypothetical protein